MSGRPAAAAAAATNVTQQPDAEPQVAPTSSLDDHSANAQVCQILGDLPTWKCASNSLFYMGVFSHTGAESSHASHCQYQRNQ